jgi:hypothetical protein
VGDVVTYDWVKVDNERQRSFRGATVSSGLNLGWTPLGVMLINFQIDGAYSSSGSIQGYFDKLQIWRW